MEPITIAYLAGGSLFIFLALGIPVGFAMGLVGVGGMLLTLGPRLAFGQLQTLPFAVVNDYSLAVLPMFVLMGVLAEASGVTTEVFRVADLWLRRLKGGLYQAVIVGSAVFAAISGSTAVNAVVFTRIAFPEMLRFGYSRSLSLGAIAGAGSFAAMIPPSITMVIYAVMTEQSVGQLLIAGVIPGILTAAVYLAGIAVLVRVRPSLAPDITEVVSWRERWRAAGQVWPIAVLMLLVYIGLRLLLTTQFGRILVSIRENERRTGLLGYDTRRYKLAAFMLAGGVAGLGGSFYAMSIPLAHPEMFSLGRAADVIMWVLVGGKSTLIGPIAGVFAIEYFKGWLGTQGVGQVTLVLGAVLIIFVLVFQRGLLPTIGTLPEMWTDRVAVMRRVRDLPRTIAAVDWGVDELVRILFRRLRRLR